ncbi:MAG: sigma-54 dependent transcriptional regulator [Melioribacteraceae bacterium]|nr:sigma-54 dependent transcriptional regulator [Melioribacteraceae bacterium]
MTILLIEDEKIARISLTNTLKSEGYDVTSSSTGIGGLEIFYKNNFDVVITDLRLPKMNGIEILKKVKEKSPNTILVVMTAYATVETAIDALKLGAYDYITKPFSPDKLLQILSNINQLAKVKTENIGLKKRLKLFESKEIIAESGAMKKVMDTVKIVAKNDYSVLIEGESGTGKEIVANSLHFYSERINKPFIAINASAIPESLLESELFGHEKGSFTGADKKHIGYFERANGGTLFIDDIDDLPTQVQVKLLRVLQEREIVRVGGSDIVKVDVRIVAATKVNLKELVDEKKFRNDLFYRLNIIPLKIPALRVRKEDIIPLVEHFFLKYNSSNRISKLDNRIMIKLINYNWPGNVRELENFVQRMIALSSVDGWEEEMFSSLTIAQKNNEDQVVVKNSEVNYPSYSEYILEKDKEIIEWAIKKAKNNISLAAELLDLPRSTLRSKIEKMGKIREGFNNTSQIKCL